MPARFDHLTMTVTDLGPAAEFYAAALAPLGLSRVVELVDEEEDDAPVEAVAYGAGGVALLWLVTGTEPTRHLHVSLRADHRDEVTAFHAAALAHGGREHSAPRRWPIYRRGEFSAAVRDPAGNLVEVVAPE